MDLSSIGEMAKTTVKIEAEADRSKTITWHMEYTTLRSTVASALLMFYIITFMRPKNLRKHDTRD